LCAPEMPEAPNPIKVSGLQTQSNVQTAVANAWLNNTDTLGPLGSTDYVEQGYRNIQIPAGKNGQRVRNVRVPIFKQINRLSTDQQRLLDLQEQSGQNIGELAVQQSDRMQDYLRQGIDPNTLPDDVRNAAQAEQLLRAQSPDDFVAEKHRTEDALMARLNPQLDRDQNSLLTRLANQGVTPGSEAYNRAMDQFGRQSNDARMQAILGAGQEQNRLYGLEQQRVGQANQAIQGNYSNQLQSQAAQQTLRQQALQEEAFLRNQPISEINQLMRGSAPTMPQFQGWNGPTVANTDVSGNFYRSAALEQQNYMSQMQQQNAMMGGLFGLGGAFAGLFSDRRLKDNIKKVGKLDNGLDVYSYTMNGVPQIGLIAQEVEKVKPEAVGEIGGFKTVRYDLAVEA
jgi:hypothetical protein